jgi:hypothetical protein
VPHYRLGSISSSGALAPCPGVQPPPSGPAVKGGGVAEGRPVVIVVTRPDTAVPSPGTTLPTDDVTGPMGLPDGDDDGDGDVDVDPVPGPEPSGVATRLSGRPVAPGTSLGCCRCIALA